MKRFCVAYIVSLLFCLPAVGQSLMNASEEIDNLQVTRADGRVKIAMDIDLSKFDVGSTEIYILTPYLENGGDSLELPSVEILGRRADLYLIRNDKGPVTPQPLYFSREATRKERKAGEKQSLAYVTDVAFEDWMRGATVRVKEGSCGCNPEVVQNADKPVGSLLPELYEPQYVISYAEPDPEPIKMRDESFTAYINFWVDKYDIREKYKNNATELAGVLNSIEKVADDEDLTITAITIEGWASPEATQYHNQVLSQNRANSLANWISKKTGIDRDKIEAIGCGEDWAGLRARVDATPGLLDRDKVYAIIDDASLTQDQKDLKLSRMQPPTIYKRLMDEMYPRLRRNDYRIEYKVRNFNLEEARVLVDSDPRKLSVSEMYKVAGSYERDSKEYRHVMDVAAETYPSVVAAAVNKAVMQIEAEQWDAALATLAKSDTSDARIITTQGNAYWGKGDTAKARECWSKAADAGNADAAHNLAEIDKYLATY